VRTLGLGVCLCTAEHKPQTPLQWGPFSAARALRAHQECGQHAGSGVLQPGSSAAEHHEHTVSRLHPQASAHTGGAARRGSAIAYVRRAAAAAWAALAPCPSPLQVVRAQRAQTGAERGAHTRLGRRTRGTPVRARCAGRAAYWARERTHWWHARVPRAAGREGPAAAQAGQWCRPRTGRVAEKVTEIKD